MGNILIVDDNELVNDLIAMNLDMANHNYKQAFCGDEALSYIELYHFDLVLLDVILPGASGYNLISKFEEKNIPVIFLTSNDSLADKVKGLNLGAYDYIVKPFEALELIARIDAVIRRTEKNTQKFSLGNVEVRFDEHLVLLNGKPIDLTPKEYDLLCLLIKNCGMALTRDNLLHSIWGDDYDGEIRTVDIHIQRLRKKLGWENVIKTVYKHGYRLEKNA